MSSRYPHDLAVEEPPIEIGSRKQFKSLEFEAVLDQNNDNTNVDIFWSDWLQSQASPKDISDVGVTGLWDWKGYSEFSENNESINSPISQHQSQNSFDGMSLEDIMFSSLASEVSPLFPPADMPVNRSTQSMETYDKVKEPRPPHKKLSLTSPSKVAELWKIAMPDQTSKSLASEDLFKEVSPPSPAAPTSTEPRPLKRRKKTSTKTQNSHSAVEKRYRLNLNDKISLLRQCIPVLHLQPNGDDSELYKRQHKYGKAAVLTGAINYATHLETSIERLAYETKILTARVTTFESIMSGAPYSKLQPAISLQTIQEDFKYNPKSNTEMGGTKASKGRKIKGTSQKKRQHERGGERRKGVREDII